MNHWVVCFYLHSLMLLFEWFCKSISFNRTPPKINCIKNCYPKKISEKSSDPKKYERFFQTQKNKNIKNFRPKKISRAPLLMFFQVHSLGFYIYRKLFSNRSKPTVKPGLHTVRRIASMWLLSKSILQLFRCRL